MMTNEPKVYTSKVINFRWVTKDVYIIRIERNEIEFRSGQYIGISVYNKTKMRDYSIYSAEQCSFLEILIKQRSSDEISQQLKNLKAGELVQISQPKGKMVIDGFSQKYVFIATGTSISPFHSIVLSYPDLNYMIVHGVSYLQECFDLQDYNKSNYRLCVSRENAGDFQGHVIEYLKQNAVEKDSICFLSGNYDVVFEIFHLLQMQGLQKNQIKSEYLS